MSIIMKNIGGYRQAHYITQAEAEKMVADGTAIKHYGYDIYEEQAAEYITKVMQPKRSYRKKSDQASTEDEA
jgi:hypothetical protein